MFPSGGNEMSKSPQAARLYIYIYVYIHTCIYVHMYLSIYLSIYIIIYMYVYIYIYICIYSTYIRCWNALRLRAREEGAVSVASMAPPRAMWP